jgi:hypothetical protein
VSLLESIKNSKNMKTEGLKLIKKEKLKVTLNGNKIALPHSIQKDIEDFWKELLSQGGNFKRGEVFTIKNIEDKDGVLRIELGFSDYAHYLFTQRIGLDTEHACKNLHTSCLIETADNKLVFGKMGEHTAIAGTIQCVGGGLDNDDVRGNEVDLENNIIKELTEEAGIDVRDKSLVDKFEMKYLRFSLSQNKVAAIFVLKLKIDSEEFKKHYEKFEKQCKERGEKAEFDEMVYLSKDKTKIESFIQKEMDLLDHYMEDLLKSEAQI